MLDMGYSLDTLYARFDAMAAGHTKGDGRAAHDAVVARLAENRRVAEHEGWTSCALERSAGMGRLRLLGIAPGAETREAVPDFRGRGR